MGEMNYLLSIDGQEPFTMTFGGGDLHPGKVLHVTKYEGENTNYIDTMIDSIDGETIKASSISAEQQARNMLESMGIDDAQEMSAGDLVELANLIAFSPAFNTSGTTPK